MTQNSTIILTDTAGVLDTTGTKYKGDGFNGFTDGLHTVMWYLSSFKGRIIIEASLVTDPVAEDWFTVDLDNSGNGYVEITDGLTSTKAYNFTGNYVWIRAKVDRTNYTAGGLTTANSGSVSKVLFNH